MIRFLYIVFLLLTGLCSAQLSWDQTRIEVKTKPHQKSIEGTYTFKNSGKTVITISKVVTSCGCTTVELDKKVYKPGESGTIKTKLTMPPENPGDVQKYVYVRSNDAETPLKKLTIKAVRPKFLIIDTPYIKWNYKEDPVAKFINIKVEDGQKLTIKKLESSNPEFKAELITIKEGDEYKIKITPPHTNKPIRTLLRIITDYPEEKPLIFNLSARVAVKAPF